jgi:hypothetical protein
MEREARPESAFRIFGALLRTGVGLGFLLVLSFGSTRAAAQLPGTSLDYGVGGYLSPTNSNNSPYRSGRGKVFDRDGLKQTRSYCVDGSSLEGSEAAEVRVFLAQDGGPKKLLSRLPWALIDDCTKADAVARIYFAPASVIEVLNDKGTALRQVFAHDKRPYPVLLVYDKASIRLFYRAEGSITHGDPTKVLGSPFSMLLKDLKTVAR